MTRNEMLKRMGLREDQLIHLLESFSRFYNSLDAAQKKVVNRSLPTLERAAKTFGPDVNPVEIQKYFDTNASGATFNSEMGELESNRGSSDTDDKY